MSHIYDRLLETKSLCIYYLHIKNNFCLHPYDSDSPDFADGLSMDFDIKAMVVWMGQSVQCALALRGIGQKLLCGPRYPVRLILLA